MDEPVVSSPSEAKQWGKRAQSLVHQLFVNAGWSVDSGRWLGGFQPDLVARQGRDAYAVEIKAAAEGRSDRLVPLLAQAVLQAQRVAGHNAVPLAVVAAPKIPRRAAEHVLRFAEKYVPDVAVGMIDFEGLRIFRGPRLEQFNAEPEHRPSIAVVRPRQPGHLFADLNQWMLKVLLAPELPEELLSAPRGQYRNASQLARAAQVSIMSAFRFVQQLKDAGYLHESASHLSLVRRAQLFEQWQAVAKPVKEIPVRFLLAGDPSMQLRKMLDSGRACLALFAAADALKLGFVEGVPPYVYVQRIQPASLPAWKNVRPCAPGEFPHAIVRQAPAPQSVFRGIVRREGMASCDVLQVWADVASHPARGREQAEHIRRRVLDPLINKNH
jgi:hypothetical protein